jgi:hypothetical protein
MTPLIARGPSIAPTGSIKMKLPKKEERRMGPALL